MSFIQLVMASTVTRQVDTEPTRMTHTVIQTLMAATVMGLHQLAAVVEGVMGFR